MSYICETPCILFYLQFSCYSVDSIFFFSCHFKVSFCLSFLNWIQKVLTLLNIRYQSMLRVQKKYILPFRRTGTSDPSDTIPGHTVAFSSYPGILSSGDDFYVLSSGLTSLETTIGNGNPALWKNVTATGEVSGCCVEFVWTSFSYFLF